MHLFFNNQLIKEEDFKLLTSNRAFNYGDGVFETMAVKAGQILYMNDHFDRLTGGVKALSITLPEYFDKAYLEKSIKALLTREGFNGGRIKLQVWRKPGGLFTPADNGADFLITAGELKQAREVKNSVGFFDKVPKAYSAISRYKTCNALPYILAGVEAAKQGLDDMILLDANCNVSESTSSNVFWEKDSVMYTPSLDSACIDGVMRRQLLSFFKQEGIACEEGLYNRVTVEHADLVFTSNIAGISCIERIDSKTYSTTSAIVNKIRARFA